MDSSGAAEEFTDSSSKPSDVETNFTYQMNMTGKRGIFILINQMKDFDANTGDFYEKDRQETQKADLDGTALKALFEDLGFEVRPYENRTKGQMRDILMALQKEDCTEKICFACAILTFGKDGMLYGTDGSIDIKQLAKDVSKAKIFKGKPKFFIIQTSTGETEIPRPTDSDAPAETRMIKLPLFADFLYYQSTTPGFELYGDDSGSWFVQQLVKVFREHAHNEDVLSMLTRVNERVAKLRLKGKLPQLPSITSQLRKDLRLPLKSK